MAASHVLRLPVNNDDAAFVLLSVASKGRKALDLELVATEGSGRYATILKHDRVASLRVKNCPASETEWEEILQHVLRQEPIPDIHASAIIQTDSSISVTIRKQIQGITQRLGAITLNYDMNEDIQLFDWCGVAAGAASENKAALASSETKVQDLEKSVSELKSQLDDLVKAKQEDETVLLHKFRDLLNEKKIKIREQQKVLASGSFSSASPNASQPTRVPAQSRSGKRKAKAKANAESDEDEEDDGFQKMDVDEVKEEQADETDPGNTTDGTASTASDQEEDDGPPTTRSKDSSSQPQRGSQAKKATENPPPRRDLPFNHKKPPSSAPAPAAAAGSETESDDEL